MIRSIGKYIGAAAILMTVVELTSAGARAQGRRGGPRDWSHRHLVAARSGPDGDRNIGRSWRTYLKQSQIDAAHASRDPFQDWLDKFLNRERKPQAAADAPHLDWNLRTGGTGSVVGYPAKYSFDVSASNCSDVIYFTVDQAGSSSAVNVIAITNPYAGCSGNPAGTTPTVKFGLRLGTGTATSPAISLDGKVLYVFESITNGLILHAINVGNITTQTGTYNFGTGNWSNAHTLKTSPIGTASSEQLFQIPFTNVTNNVASPFIDYDNNQIYFGDSGGRIRRVNNVDKASAAADANFPVACGAAQLKSPVFWNGQVIASSADGRLYRIDTTLPAPYSCIASQQGAAGVSGGVGGGLSTPIVDVTNNQVIVGTNNVNGIGMRAYGASALNFASGDAPTSYILYGTSSTTIAPVEPAFDDQFWTTNTGNLYASGTNAANTNTYLLRIPYNGTISGTIAGSAVLHSSSGNAVVATSPVTEFLTSAPSNPDYIFIGGAGTTGNYRYMNRISAGFSGTDASPSVMTSFFSPVGGMGISSGIIIDTRTAAMTGSTATANIYFGTAGSSATSTQSRIVQLAQGF
jgi:hypothetical protein